MNDVKDGLVSKFKVHIVSNSYCKSKLGTLTDRTEVLYQPQNIYLLHIDILMLLVSFLPSLYGTTPRESSSMISFPKLFAWMKHLSDSSLPACATTHREGARCCKSEGETVPD